MSNPAREIFFHKIIPALSAGLSSGLGLLVAQIAFGSFIFSGALAPYTSQGIGLVLFGNFAACLIIALLGGYRGAISGLSPALVVVMAMIGFTKEAEGDVLFVTTAGALMIGAVTASVCCLAIGYFRLSSLVRFIPYPVSTFFSTPHSVPGGHVPDGGGTGLAGDSSVIRASRTLEMEPGSCIRYCPVPGNEALE